MPWVYEIMSGNLYDPTGKFVYRGYSGGDQGRHPEGVNNPDDEGLKNIGPLPEGLYTFGTPVEHTHLGPYAIPLTPDPSNDMKGRSGFFMHGDTVAYHAASEGCIIMPKTVRENCKTSQDQQIHVVKQFVNTVA